MDKQTLSNYGWVIITVLVLAVMIALATPFGSYIKEGAKSTLTGLFESSENALNVGLKETGATVSKAEFDNVPTVDNNNEKDETNNGDALNHKGIIPEGGRYIKATGTYNYEGTPITIYLYESPEEIGAGQPFPEPQNGDIYYYNNYVYIYNGTLINDAQPASFGSEDVGVSISINGWFAGYTKSELNNENEAMVVKSPLATINNKPITSMHYAYSFYQFAIDVSVYFDNVVIPETVTNGSALIYEIMGAPVTGTLYIPEGMTTNINDHTSCVNLQIIEY